MKYGIQQAYINQINAVFAIYPAVEKVLLYGSRAKGTHEKWSDIDLAFFGETMTLSLLMKIEHELDDLLLPYKIDASIFHLIENVDMIEHINRVGVVFYERVTNPTQQLQ
ncbi:MAG: nucleotidyltransferase domain-containing protein [Aureispira sp.]